VKVQILGKPYEVVEIDPSSAPDFSGTNNRDAQTVTIVKQLGPDARDDTILHESVHLISDELCLGLTEAQVGALACGLYSAGCRVKVEK
jgi:hypothetical protein